MKQSGKSERKGAKIMFLGIPWWEWVLVGIFLGNGFKFSITIRHKHTHVLKDGGEEEKKQLSEGWYDV